jgi:hypothetical protein
MLTGREQGIYRPLVDQAWRVHCARTGRDPASQAGREEWYRVQVQKAVGFYTTKQVKMPQEFDRLCLHFATVAGDEKAIGYWSAAAERREMHRLQMTMRTMGVDRAYVHGIARQMGFPDKGLESLPAELIHKLNTALFLQSKRQEREAVRR